MSNHYLKMVVDDGFQGPHVEFECKADRFAVCRRRPVDKETAKKLICLPDDGLSAPWEGRVWLNPPYGQEVWQWLDKLAEHHHGTALIFARTETEGFVEQVWKKATAVRFLYGRLHFHHPDGTRARANAGAPSVLVAYGPEDAARLATCTIPGKFIHLRKDPSLTADSTIH